MSDSKPEFSSTWFLAEKPFDPWWPLRFDGYKFGARCYNTLRSSILFKNHQLALSTELNAPSGTPHSPDWKDKWEVGFGVMDKMDVPLPPVDIDWTALDGVERNALIDLEEIFPNHQILHQVARGDVHEYWAIHHRHLAEILVEVNDRTINVYMKAKVATKLHPSYPETLGRSKDLILAWTMTY